MNQQRGRRFRSAKEAELQEEKARQKGETLPAEARFDSNCITPGTPFMCRLNDALRYFIQHKISTSKNWRNCKVILSGHETPGEGEHKIMEYIRFQKADKSYDANTRHCLYGLDADLIMLGLCTHERHFSLLREEVKFGKNNSKAVSVTQQRFFLLHLSLMREYLEQEFITLKGNMKIPFDIEKIIDDWVLMGFLVGNDFIPNIPNLHINSNALPMLYNAYIKTMQNLDGYINEGGKLNLPRLQAYIENLAVFDRDFFTSQYDDLKFLESKHQGAFNKRNDDTFGGNKELMDLVKATEFEFDSDPEQEEDDEDEDEEPVDLDDDACFEKEFHQHRRHYYVDKMKYDDMTEEVLAEQAECYIRALQWTLSYYYHGVQSWSWYYPHHYAPFISDLKNFKNLVLKFDMSEPFLPFQQLMSVLPAGSRAHVPECYKKLMTSPDSELIEFYPQNFETDLNGKKQEWEAVVLIPFIDEKKLLSTLKKHDCELSPEEKARNVHGPMYAYTYSAKCMGSLDGPLTFPSIGKLMCSEQKIFREDVMVPTEKLVLGPSKGAMKHVYFTGFPTFKHLTFKTQLKNQSVKVFDQPSRGESMIVCVDPGEDTLKSLDELVPLLLGKTVHVGWPHLIEAKVVRICDHEQFVNLDKSRDKTDPQRWKNDTQSIKDHHSNRMGIDVGEITHIVHVQQLTGDEYRFDAAANIFKMTKTYNRQELAYPLQCVVKNIKAYRKKFTAELSIFDAFKNGTEVLMLANPYYGSFGEVVDVNCYEKTKRVKVMLTVPVEPEFNKLIDQHEKIKSSYLNSYQTAQTLSISENVFNRITGTVLVIPGNKRQITSEDTSKQNIGLQLKFPKANEELVGYSKKDSRGRLWLYSEKVIGLVQDYYCKFPSVFEVLGKKTGNTNDIYFESDFFDTTHGEENLASLRKWIASLPSAKAERRTVGSESCEKETLQGVVDAVKKVKGQPMKKVGMQVKPHLLFVPSLTQSTTKAPDAKADFQIFDRVIVAKESEKFSAGMRGTVVGIHRIKDLNPVRQECVNKEDVFAEILFDKATDLKTDRVAIENLINITFGYSLTQVSSNVVVTPTKNTRYEEKTKPVEPVTSAGTFSEILKKAPQTNGEKKQNFADMWNSMKTNQAPAPAPNKQAGNLSDLMAKAKISTNGAPVIVAPSQLPLPPMEWLGKIEKKLDVEKPNQSLPVMPSQPMPMMPMMQIPRQPLMAMPPQPLMPMPFFNQPPMFANGHPPGPPGVFFQNNMNNHPMNVSLSVITPVRLFSNFCLLLVDATSHASPATPPATAAPKVFPKQPAKLQQPRTNETAKFPPSAAAATTAKPRTRQPAAAAATTKRREPFHSPSSVEKGDKVEESSGRGQAGSKGRSRRSQGC